MWQWAGWKKIDAMSVENKGPGRFYCNFKMHKKHDHKQAPPVRPITSGSGSLTEGIGTYVEHYIKHGATSHQTYLKDTPDFLRHIAKTRPKQSVPNSWS